MPAGIVVSSITAFTATENNACAEASGSRSPSTPPRGTNPATTTRLAASSGTEVVTESQSIEPPPERWAELEVNGLGGRLCAGGVGGGGGAAAVGVLDLVRLEESGLGVEEDLARGREGSDELWTRQSSDDFPSIEGPEDSDAGEDLARPPTVWMSRASGLMAVVSFWVTHTCSVYATKALLSRPGRTTRGVVLITWCQCVASFVLVLSLGTWGERQDARKGQGRWRSRLLSEMARALPTNALLGGWNSKSLLGGGASAVGLASVLFSLAVFSDNACLGVVNASFFQVARALTLPFVTLMGAISARSCPPRDLLLPCGLCVVGFCLGVRSQTPEAFTDGTSMGVMASMLTAAYTGLLARAEPREAWRVTYVTNRNASVLLVPVAVYVGMGDPTYLSGETFLLKDGATMLLAVMATVLPALAGVSTMWQAQAGLGPRGQACSFVGRAACSHLLAFHVFGNSPVAIGEAGCCLVLAGLALYASNRGGAAVAQAGNVAVPGAAREHFMKTAGASRLQWPGSNPMEKMDTVQLGGASIKRKTSDLDPRRGVSITARALGDVGSSPLEVMPGRVCRTPPRCSRGESAAACRGSDADVSQGGDGWAAGRESDPEAGRDRRIHCAGGGATAWERAAERGAGGVLGIVVGDLGGADDENADVSGLHSRRGTPPRRISPAEPAAGNREGLRRGVQHSREAGRSGDKEGEYGEGKRPPTHRYVRATDGIGGGKGKSVSTIGSRSRAAVDPAAAGASGPPPPTPPPPPPPPPGLSDVRQEEQGRIEAAASFEEKLKDHGGGVFRAIGETLSFVGLAAVRPHDHGLSRAPARERGARVDCARGSPDDAGRVDGCGASDATPDLLSLGDDLVVLDGEDDPGEPGQMGSSSTFRRDAREDARRLPLDPSW